MSGNSNNVNTWAAELGEELCKFSEKFRSEWCDIVTRTGLEDSVRLEWIKVVKEQVDSLYQDMIDDVRGHQNRLIAKIEALLKKCEVLCKDLGIKMPHFGSEERTLREEYLIVAEKVQEFEEHVQKRKCEITALRKQQDKLCFLLGTEQKIIPESPLPNEQFLDEIRNYIEALENEKFIKTEKFIKIKTAIVDLSNEIGYQPNLNFERDILSDNDSNFILTDSNMNQLDDFYERLTQLHHSITEEIAVLTDKIKSLWEMFNEDVKTCSEFLEKHNQVHLDTLEALKQEVNRLNQAKRANIEKFVKTLRAEIEKLWAQCHLTDEQRHQFEYFQADLYTEDLLTIHDLEIQKLRRYYDENSELLNLLETRSRMWIKLSELEQCVNAPERFKNRGGQLLREEKERNTVSKRIPVIESRLLELAEKFEERVGVPFMSWGQTIQEIIEGDTRNREEEKLLKSNARKKDKTVTPGKSVLTLTHASSHNLLSSCKNNPLKRKLIPTPDMTTKKPKVLGENNAATTSKKRPPKVLLNGKPIKEKSRSSIERLRIRKKYIRLSREREQRSQAENQTRTSSEYDTFEREIQNKENCRSTLFGHASTYSSDIEGVAPLPTTPRRPKTPTNGTPHSTKPQQRTPLTASKFSAAPSLQSHF